jgi:hypothetical protein
MSVVLMKAPDAASRPAVGLVLASQQDYEDNDEQERRH